MTGNGEWIRTYENGPDYLESLGGISWADVPEPSRWHTCKPQTRGCFGLNYAERCACGAYRERRDLPWLNKNERREDRKRQRREARMPREQVTCTACGQEYEAIRDSSIARERLCTTCWGDVFMASGGRY